MAEHRTTPADFEQLDAAPLHAPSGRAAIPVAGFYVAWCGLAFLRHLAGRTTIAPAAAMGMTSAVTAGAGR